MSRKKYSYRERKPLKRYETQLPPINILTFYNAIANNGVTVKPRFVKAVMRDGKVVKEYPTEIINPKICSDSTLAKIRTILRSVVKNGLAKPAGNNQFAVSGKTGTAQISKGKEGYKSGRVNYLVSFCGYFPSEAPRYSCIVSIQKPGLPASGGLMAGSVFGQIAERVFAQDLRFDLSAAIDSASCPIPSVKPGELQEARAVLTELDIPVEEDPADDGQPSVWGTAKEDSAEVRLQAREAKAGLVPNVVGMGAKDAVYLLESQGLKVRLSGIGRVRKQSLPAGSRAVKGRTVALTLR